MAESDNQNNQNTEIDRQVSIVYVPSFHMIEGVTY